VNKKYFFDGWSVDAASGELVRGGKSVRLQDHPLQLLLALLERPGEVVGREELIARLWPTGVVDYEMGLNTAVRRLRIALGDEAEQPRYIETLPRRGYRFIGRLEPAVAPAGIATVVPVAAATPVRGRRPGWLALGSVLLVAVLVAAIALHRHARPGPLAARSIAVLPFVDMSAGHDEQYLADGMAEEILDLLATIPALKVIARTSSFSFRGRSVDLREMGEQLGAAYIVEGSVRRSGSQVRIGAQLVDAASGARLWSGAYDREYRDVLALQEQIAAGIARALQLAVGGDFVHADRKLADTDAYTYYLRGRWVIDRGDEGMREAKSNFEQSLALDPTSVKATEALSLAYLEEIGDRLTPSAVGWPAAEDAARRALALDPRSALAHAMLGLEKVTYEYDWQGANAELDRTLALKSHDPYALYIGAWLAFDLGRHAEALRLQDAALAIDPLNPDSIQNGAYIHYLMGDFAAAERGFRRSIEISPTFGGNHRMLGELLLQQGRTAEALVEFEAEPEVSRDLGLAIGYFAAGRRKDADVALARMEHSVESYGEFNFALVHAFRGERDLAFRWLERAVVLRDLNLGHRLRYDWMLEPLRKDPRYHALLQRMHVPE
jgi:TolB-like protein/DNA-binding winged helix-turn-helix (wHTH) protein